MTGAFPSQRRAPRANAAQVSPPFHRQISPTPFAGYVNCFSVYDRTLTRARRAAPRDPSLEFSPSPFGRSERIGDCPLAGWGEGELRATHQSNTIVIFKLQFCVRIIGPHGREPVPRNESLSRTAPRRRPRGSRHLRQ